MEQRAKKRVQKNRMVAKKGGVVKKGSKKRN